MNRALKISWYAIITAIALWGSGIIPAIIPDAVPTANKQGNSAKFQLAGTVSGTGASICTDASGNTTTSGCPGTGSGTVNTATQFQIGEYLTAGAAISGVSIPNCVDSGGNHVNFTSATGVFTCGTSGGGGGGNLLYPAFTPIVDGNLTWANQQTASSSFSNNIEYMTVPQLLGDFLCAREQPVPNSGTTPWSVVVGVIPTLPQVGNGQSVGIEVRDSVGGHMAAIQVDVISSVAPHVGCTQGTLTGWSNVTSTGVTAGAGAVAYLKARNDGTNLVFSASQDGVNFSQTCSILISTFANAPNKVGIFVQSENATINTSGAFVSYLAGN